MSKSFENKIKECEARLDNSKNTLEISTRNINNEINYFGNYRKETLEKTIGRFNEYLRLIGKKSKDKTYDIPYSINAQASKPMRSYKRLKYLLMIK